MILANTNGLMKMDIARIKANMFITGMTAIIEMNATKRKTIGEMYEEIINFIATHINGVNWMQFK